MSLCEVLQVGVGPFELRHPFGIDVMRERNW